MEVHRVGLRLDCLDEKSMGRFKENDSHLHNGVME
jgi:hypothetical protein